MKMSSVHPRYDLKSLVQVEGRVRRRNRIDLHRAPTSLNTHTGFVAAMTLWLNLPHMSIQLRRIDITDIIGAPQERRSWWGVSDAWTLLVALLRTADECLPSTAALVLGAHKCLCGLRRSHRRPVGDLYLFEPAG